MYECLAVAVEMPDYKASTKLGHYISKVMHCLPRLWRWNYSAYFTQTMTEIFCILLPDYEYDGGTILRTFTQTVTEIICIFLPDYEYDGGIILYSVGF